MEYHLQWLYRLSLLCVCLVGAFGPILRQCLGGGCGHYYTDDEAAFAAYSALPVLMLLPPLPLRTIVVMFFLASFPVMLVEVCPQFTTYPCVFFFWVSVFGAAQTGIIFDEYYQKQEEAGGRRRRRRRHLGAEEAPPSVDVALEVLPRILVVKREEEEEEECCICLVSSSHRLRECRHTMCLECAAGYLEALQRQPWVPSRPQGRRDMACPVCRTPYCIQPPPSPPSPPEEAS